MPNSIPFPKNYDRFIQLGKEAMNNNELKSAIDFFHKAYKIRPGFSLNVLLTNTYLEIGNNDQALCLAIDKKEEYLSCVEYTEMFVCILVQNHKFIDAYCLINERILLERTGELKKLIMLKKKVKELEQQYEATEMESIKLLEDELMELDKYNYQKQLATLKKARKLPQKEFIVIGKRILLNKRVHKLVRSWILEEFAKLHIKESIEFIWRDDKIHQIIPIVTGNALDCGSYQRILLFLEKELVNNDPVLLAEILQDIKLDFLLIYPLADEVILNPNLWAISYLITYNDGLTLKYQTEENRKEIEDIQKKQKEIHNELKSIAF